MIKITIDSKEVDLPSDFCFEYTEENMLMEEDTLPVPFTTSIEFPLKKSLRNQSIFRHKHRVTSITSDLIYKCIVYVDGFILVDGWYTVDSMGDVVSGELKVVNPTNDLDKPIDKFDWPRIYVGDAGVTVGGKGNIPVHLSQWRPLILNLANYLSRFGGSIRNSFIRLTSVNPTTSNMPPAGIPARYEIYSLERAMYFGASIDFKVETGMPVVNEYVLDILGSTSEMFPVLPAIDFDMIFTTILGGDVVENPILAMTNDEDMRLYCQTVTAPDFIEGRTNYPYFVQGEKIGDNLYKIYFDISKFMPSLPSSDFIKATLNLFCCSVYFNQGKVYIKRNKDIINDRAYVDLSDYAINFSSLQVDRSKTYVCGYDKLDSEPLDNNIEEVSGLNDIIISTQTGNNDTFRDRFGIVWERKKINNLTEGWQYKCIWSNHYRVKSAEKVDVFEKITSLTPMFYSAFNQWEGALTPANQWPVSKGGFRNEARYYPVTVSELNQMGSKDDMFMIGFLNDYNNVLGCEQLNINDLIRKYHREYKDWIEKDKKLVTVDMLIPASELFKMQLWNKVYFQGRIFLIKKRTMRFYMDFIDLTTLELVECQCPLITEEPT